MFVGYGRLMQSVAIVVQEHAVVKVQLTNAILVDGHFVGQLGPPTAVDPGFASEKCPANSIVK